MSSFSSKNSIKISVSFKLVYISIYFLLFKLNFILHIIWQNEWKSILITIVKQKMLFKLYHKVIECSKTFQNNKSSRTCNTRKSNCIWRQISHYLVYWLKHTAFWFYLIWRSKFHFFNVQKSSMKLKNIYLAQPIHGFLNIFVLQHTLSFSHI